MQDEIAAIWIFSRDYLSQLVNVIEEGSKKI
jgi:hypothetical protein